MLKRLSNILFFILRAYGMSGVLHHFCMEILKSVKLQRLCGLIIHAMWNIQIQTRFFSYISASNLLSVSSDIRLLSR